MLVGSVRVRVVDDGAGGGSSSPSTEAVEAPASPLDKKRKQYKRHASTPEPDLMHLDETCDEDGQGSEDDVGCIRGDRARGSLKKKKKKRVLRQGVDRLTDQLGKAEVCIPHPSQQALVLPPHRFPLSFPSATASAPHPSLGTSTHAIRTWGCQYGGITDLPQGCNHWRRHQHHVQWRCDHHQRPGRGGAHQPSHTRLASPCLCHVMTCDGLLEGIVAHRTASLSLSLA